MTIKGTEIPNIHSLKNVLLTADGTLCRIAQTYKPVAAVITQIASQVTLVFVLPLVILVMIILLNKRSVMGEKRPGWVFSLLMALAFVFACIVSYTGVVALGKLL